MSVLTAVLGDPCAGDMAREQGALECVASSELVQASATKRLQAGLVQSSPNTAAVGVQTHAPAPCSVREHSGILVTKLRTSFLWAGERVTATQRRSSQGTGGGR